MMLKGDEHPIKVSSTGGSGLARVREHVKTAYIVLEEKTEGLTC